MQKAFSQVISEPLVSDDHGQHRQQAHSVLRDDGLDFSLAFFQSWRKPLSRSRVFDNLY